MPIRARKAVLAATSDYFRDTFNKMDPNTQYLYLPESFYLSNFGPDTITWVFKFLYHPGQFSLIA